MSHVRKLPNGTWKVVQAYPDGIRYSVIESTRAAAERAAVDLEQEAANWNRREPTGE